MIVPQYWAEARRQHRESGRQVTVRRFGWSDISAADAEANAQQRVDEALQRILSGTRLPRRDVKTPYNGSEGVPIREEIVSRHGDSVVTRNSYGARCLNTPNVFFADVDFPAEPSGCLAYVTGAVGAVLFGWYTKSLLNFCLAFVAAIILANLAVWLQRLLRRLSGGPERLAWKRIEAFVGGHPEWYVRIYRTPAGLRVLAMHQTFDPTDPAVAEAFEQLGTDAIYARMCVNQNCFRARVSPKPWRMGISTHIKPRRATWPVAPDLIPKRNDWIEAYETTARNFAACTYIDSLGSGNIDPAARIVQELHDEMSQAETSLPIA